MSTISSITTPNCKLSPEQLELIIDNIADGVIVHSGKGEIVYANTAAARMYGYNSPVTFIQDNAAITRKRFKLFDEYGNPFDYRQMPSRRALAGEVNPEAIVCYQRVRTGKEQWSRVKSRLVSTTSDGILITTIITDITQEREVQKRKDDFLSIASHELKTPLTSIMGFTQILTKKLSTLSREQVEEYLKKINKYLDKSYRLVFELLEISKIQSGRIQFNKEFFDIQELAKVVVGEMQIMCPYHQLILHSTGTVMVYADRNRVGQVFINLISNAAKYSPPGTSIIIEINEREEVIEVSVHDFGIGIPAEERPHLFQRFYRINESPTSVDGLGIGLYISNAIILRHGGTMGVESEEGKGSTFHFTLPKEETYISR